MPSDPYDPGAEQSMLPLDPAGDAELTEPVDVGAVASYGQPPEDKPVGAPSEPPRQVPKPAAAQPTPPQDPAPRVTPPSSPAPQTPSAVPAASQISKVTPELRRQVPTAARPRPESIPAGMLTVEQHLETILRGVGPLEPYDQPIVESLGLPIHEDFISQHDLPRFDNSAMDGYAVRAQDVTEASRNSPVTLPVVGEIAAGSARPFAISAGTAVKIMTGAPIPRGADAVIPLEATDRGNARVVIYKGAPVGACIRPRGTDVRTGDLMLPAGTVLGPREVGLLASLGAGRVKSRPRPRVVIISTGTELREPGDHLEFDSIFDGNSFMLAAAVRSVGAIAYRVGAVDDNPKAFRRMLSDQLVRADLVVTSGGISKGDHDVVKEALSPLGTVTFSEVAMQPGKPQGFGTVFDEQTPIITLPGNAVSAYVSFEVFVMPAIRRMMGLTPYRRPMVHAVLSADLQSPPGRRQYVRGVFEVTHRGAKVTPIGGAGSHLIGGLAKANALIVVGEDETALNMGDTVRTLVLDRPF